MLLEKLSAHGEIYFGNNEDSLTWPLILFENLLLFQVHQKVCKIILISGIARNLRMYAVRTCIFLVK